MAVLFSDGFGGSDNPLSGDWETLNGTGLKKSVTGGEAIAFSSTGTDNVSCVTTAEETFADDQSAEITLSARGGSSSVNNSLIGFLTGGDPAAQLNGV